MPKALTISWLWLCVMFFVPLAQAQTAESSASDQIKPINLWQPGDPGQRLYIDGRVTDQQGLPLANVTIHIRQADGNGDYHPDRYRAKLTTDKQGRYVFGTVLPGQYYGVKHIHITAEHEFFEPLDTEINFKGDPNLSKEQEEQAVFLEQSGDEGVLYGRFEIKLKLPGQ